MVIVQDNVYKYLAEATTRGNEGGCGEGKRGEEKRKGDLVQYERKAEFEI